MGQTVSDPVPIGGAEVTDEANAENRTGYFGTQGFIAGMAAYGTYLVKGYWGY